ncbi:MAG TPA: hypothetical protein VKB51_12295 [bacterium]|nr:hypothetical protein [bacterium]
MNWSIIGLFAIYSAIGILTLIMWWIIYEAILARGYDVREAVFGKRPNPAVALDLLGGFLATGILLYSIVSLAPRTSFRLNVPAVAISIVAVLILLAVLRLLIGGLLRLWFRDHRDAQGDIVTMNNELFKQRNVATSLFSTVLYVILVAGLVELDVFDHANQGLSQIWNMLGIWLLGCLLVLIHSFFYLEYGTRNHILHECFHDNNPAAPFSLLGLVAGVLPLNHYLLITFGPGQHMFNTPELWIFLAIILAFVLLARAVLQIVMYALTGINLRYELVIADNVAWGILDGGLIFSLLLILIGLML